MTIYTENPTGGRSVKIFKIEDAEKTIIKYDCGMLVLYIIIFIIFNTSYFMKYLVK